MNQRLLGFTLIELSIVLVIIGLIVGGVLVGQDLIKAATVRAQVSQIERYNTAVNTFKGKYGYLPGDIKDPEASSFGFQTRGTFGGEGDGNGVIEGNAGNLANQVWGDQSGSGELAMFWVDLSKVGLIDGSFTTATPTAIPPVTSGSGLNLYFPQGKIGLGNYVYVWSGGFIRATQPNGVNYYGLSAIVNLSVGGGGQSGVINSNATIPVAMAYAIDKKMDDGLPQTGNVTANYFDERVGDNATWAGSGGISGLGYTTQTQGSPTTCFDNGNASGTAQQYSVEQNNGTGANCALSFRFQ